MTERLHFDFSFSCIGEGNGHPLQCFCLENPRYGEAWRASVYGVSQSWTRLKRLSSSSSMIKASQVTPVVKSSPVSAGDARDTSLTPGLGRAPGEGDGNPLRCSCLEYPIDRRAWWATVHGVAKSQT